MKKTGKLDGRRPLLGLSSGEAREFLLKPESYCRLDFPPYIRFEKLLEGVSKRLEGRNLHDLQSASPRNTYNVNYQIIHNKDGKYAWRPFELIHPVLYVSLVNEITTEDNWDCIRKRFRKFSGNKNIKCLSCPVVSMSDESDKAEQVSQWWHEVEQRSVELSLDFDYVLHTDITDCYGAIYTHSIAWALHTKRVAKNNRRGQSLIGNLIDAYVQDMRNGQTNGIPQGSVTMDFIAEMVLGYADLLVSEKLNDFADYRILRYRDDYRVFVNNQQDGDAIIKAITEVGIKLGFKLNPHKTKATTLVLRSSIKDDKIAWISRKQRDRSLQKQLLILHDHAREFPNSGSLNKALADFHIRVSKNKPKPDSLMAIIAIVVDIAYQNPRCYPVTAAILSDLLICIDDEDDRAAMIRRVIKRFRKLPNTSQMEIWLQRVTLPMDEDVEYEEPFCKLVAGRKIKIWNNDWLSSEVLKRAAAPANIVDKAAIKELTPTIQPAEIELFLNREEMSL